MLLDRGLLAREGDAYKPIGPIDTLEVPETLQALIAARLDSLTPRERSLLQDAAVLGKVFTKHGLTALTGLPDDELEPLLGALVRKEMLSIQADPRSPERGQYSFLQDLVKHVAYGTISRRERKKKHLATADFLVTYLTTDEDEAIEVVASHYLDAYAAAPEDADADQIRSKAREMLVRAGERAASLAANHEAQRAFERALELTDDPRGQADMHERAGTAAAIGARADEASGHFEQSISLFEAAGETHRAARVSARLAEVQWDRGRLEDGLANMEQSLDVLLTDEPDEDIAALAAQVGRFRFFAGDTEIAMERCETALGLAESLSLPEVFSEALNTKALILVARGRRSESSVLLRHALDTALEHDKPSAALRAFYNLADSVSSMTDRYEDAAATARRGLAHARKVGNRSWEWHFLGFAYPFYALGEWDEVLAMRAQLPHENWTRARLAYSTLLCSSVPVFVHRGRLDEARQVVEELAALSGSADVQERCYYGFARSLILAAEEAWPEALQAAEATFAHRAQMGFNLDAVKESFALAVQAALNLNDVETADGLLSVVERLPPGNRSQFLNAQVARFRARIAARQGDTEEAERLIKGAGALFHELATPFHLAVTRLEHAEWLAEQGRMDDARPILAEAREIFERLEAKPWLDRAGAETRTQIPV